MYVSFSMNNSVLIIAINGEIDHHSAEDIRKKVDSEIISSNAKKIVFDFCGVSFMDSSGIGVVMGRYKNIRNFNGSAAIANVNAHIKRVFDMSGVSKFINIYNNVDEAINSM